MGGRLFVEHGTKVYEGMIIGQSAAPLLVFDAWEHAFYLQYKNVKADYVDALWNIVSWENVADRFARARKLDIGS